MNKPRKVPEYKISPSYKKKENHTNKIPIIKQQYLFKGKGSRGMIFDFWPLPRPMTKTWGSGLVFQKIIKIFGTPDCAFGKTDNIPDSVFSVDLENGYNWIELPFKDNKFDFGYWDPPYDHLYKKEGQEIWRCCRKLAILHTHVYPTSWFKGAKRIGMVAITMGPLKQIRILQVIKK